MCFYIHPNHPEMKTAKRNIPCYKEGFRLRGFFYPRFQNNYRYSLGQLNKIEGEWPTQPSALQVCSEIKEIYSNKKHLSRRFSGVKCIIPKGAHYFYDPDDQEYVSNQIIVQEFI